MKTSSMASIPTPFPFREKLLTNSAAEFSETQATEILHLVSQVDGSSDDGTNSIEAELPDFVIELDCFIGKQQVPDLADIHKQANEQMVKFQDTLRHFTDVLKKRQAFADLGLDIKDPTQYDIAYVLSIAEKINEERGRADNTRTCKAFIRKCSEAVYKRRSLLTGFLQMIPDDVYGSVISGGFSVILVAVEKHEKMRDEIQAALADIPRKLENVKRLSEVHMPSLKLYVAANAVFVAIFVVLERIIDRLSMGSLERGLAKVRGQAPDLTEALTALGKRIELFQTEVDYCRDRRMGRVEKATLLTLRELMNTRGRDQELKNTQKQGFQDMGYLIEGIYNMIYRLLTSSPDFNPIDGTANHLQEIAQPSPKQLTESIDIDKWRDLVDRWMQGLDGFDPAPKKQITELLSNFEDLDLAEKDKAQWMMGQDEVTQWLNLTQSCILNIEAEDAPEENLNPLSFTSATLALTLATAANYPVLSFFCGMRTNDSHDPSNSGPMAILKSLNGQLVKFIKEQRPSVDLGFLDTKKYMKKAKDKPKYAMALFKACLDALPELDAIFIILDSFSRRMRGDRATGNRIIEELASLAYGFPDLVIKLLVTDALVTCPIRKLADVTLYVPNEVDGNKNDIDRDFLDQTNKDAISKFKGKREKASLESDGSLEDSDDDSW